MGLQFFNLRFNHLKYKPSQFLHMITAHHTVHIAKCITYGPFELERLFERPMFLLCKIAIFPKTIFWQLGMQIKPRIESASSFQPTRRLIPT